MDVVTAIKRLEFLGQEFLIWLWFMAERQGGVIRLPDGSVVGIEPINVMTLASGQGPTGFTVACRGRQVDSPETRVALQQGRRLTRAGFRVRTDQAAWHLTLDAATGALTGVRPAPDPEHDDDSDEDLLARLLKIRDLAAVLDSLLKMFLAIRLDERWEGEELPALRRWIASG
ncbi:MAG: hypothetical protein KJ621_01670 [Proteobacteria bacterium]|nr:hypothetical protein [Pseudomonadota bacterium]MBU1740324.1 hypothetical protein [Pseudomonadota bacterium]